MGEREEVVNCFSVNSKNQDEASLETVGCHDKMVKGTFLIGNTKPRRGAQRELKVK